MLLRFFRINDPYRLLAVLAVLLMLALPLWLSHPGLLLKELHQYITGEAISRGQTLYTQWFDSVPPLAGGLAALLDTCFGRNAFGWNAVGILLVFLQAAVFGWTLIVHRAYNENTYLPSLIYAILCVSSFDLLRFSPELVGSLLLLMALNQLFNEIEFREQREDVVIRAGFLLGLATLVVFSYWVFFLFAWIALLIYAGLTIRKSVLLVTGFLLPHLLLVVGYFLIDQTYWLWHNFYAPNFQVGTGWSIDVRSLAVIGGIPFLYFIIALFMLQREAHFTRYQSQLLQVMFLWLVAAGIQVSISGPRTPTTFIVFAPAVTYFISHYLLLVRRRWIANVMLVIMVVGVAISAQVVMRGYSGRDAYARMLVRDPDENVKGQKVMILTESNAGLLKSNQQAGFFLDWSLSEPIWQQPQVLEHALLIERSFSESPPDLIFDPQGYFEKISTVLPGIYRGYSRTGDFWQRKPEAN
ncbi:MAG: hypothetical protein ACK5DD_09270 [Cyclobacteriaceae bacterium]